MANVAVLLPGERPPADWEALLEAAGHRVARRIGREALQRAQAGDVDVLVVAEHDAQGVREILARMREPADAGDVVPLMVLQAGAELEARVALLAAPLVHDVMPAPQAGTEVVARVEALVRARRRLERLQAQRGAQVAEAEARTLVDAVTGLKNRVFLGDRLNEEWRRSSRYNEPLSLILIGLDGWRELAATRGATFGERVLRDIGQVAVGSLRQIDIVTRYGGAELAALLPNTHFAGSCTCAVRLRQAVARLEVEGLRPSVSMGIAFFPGKDVTAPADLMRIAAQALERARDEGTGKVCLFQHQGYLLEME